MKQSSIEDFLDKPLSRFVTLDWEKALYVALVVLALATRLWGLGARVQSHDESLHTKYSWNLYVGQGFRHTPLMHGPFLFHATALSYFLFGNNDFTARLAVALIGVAVVAFPYLLRRWLGRIGALVASFLLLISPSITYYSRYIRHDIPVILWSLIVIFAVFSYLRDGRDRWLYLMAAGISLAFATKEVAFIYNAIIGFFLVGLFVREALVREWQDEDLKPFVGFALVIFALGLLVMGVGLFFAGGPGEAGRTPPWWAFGGALLATGGLLAALVVLLAGTWQHLRDYRSFDLLIVLGTLCLPFLAPIPIKLLGFDPVDYTPPTLYYSLAVTAVVFLASVGIGVAWDWRRWSIAAAIHYAIFVVLFTTVFTNGSGISTGLVGSMGYWLAQQGVKRGAQPWYYYGIMVPLYEYLPLMLTLVALACLGFREILRSDARSQSPPSHPSKSLFLFFLAWWIALAWILYSYAGEKMPWLTVHLALPMILLSGWAVGRFVETTNWRRIVRRRAWLLTLVVPPFVMALGVLIVSVRSGPFQGYELAQLDVTGRFVGGLIGTLAFGAGAGLLIWRSGWRPSLRLLLLTALLVPLLLTIRTSWRFCYISGDYPTEYLVYAHAGPAVKDTMRQLEELSRRVAGGPRLIKVAYGDDGSWPFHWYLRDYPNAVFYADKPSREQMDAPVVIAGQEQWEAVAPYVSRDYIANTYIYLWWPMEDYKGLTWERIRNAITNPQMRAALWDIWYDRDYRRYDEVTDKTHTLDEWPLRSQYRLYVRRDTAAQIWDLGVAEPEELEETDPYAEGWRELTARTVFGVQGSAQGELQSPRDVAIGPEGFVYVADAGNHRVQKFTADGEFVAAWGGRSIAQEETGGLKGFNEPWGIAVAPDGNVYVADTWNHRIQELDAEGSVTAAWGFFGEFGPDDSASGQGAFYGPRDVAIGADSLTGSGQDRQVYVADTGNKRIQVFERDGQFAFQWGGAGATEGQLDEPVGIALGPDGAVYVADTWNRRVQVFDANGAFLRQWPIQGWDAGTPEEKPYLAVDGEGRVYVTDPGYYRVLVFDDQGNYLLSFGQYGTDKRSFALPMGIAVAGDGTVYVTDAHAHRVLVFDPIDFQSKTQ